MVQNKVTAKLLPLGNGTKSYEAVFLVDTGVIDSMVLSTELEKTTCNFPKISAK